MTISLRGNEIHIKFTYNPATLAVVKQIPDRQWDPIQRVWTVPATAWHSRQVISQIGDRLSFDRDVTRLAQRDKRDWNHSTLDLSVDDNLIPYPYQAGAVEFLDLIGGRGLIGDEVGIGKTIEFLAFVRYKDITRFLVVCPASVLYKWEREIIRWYPEVAGRVQVIEDGRTKITGNVCVISYDMMSRRYKELVGKFKMICFDEVHKLKNHKTQRAKAASALSKGVPYILGMSGTPIINRPRELYNILHIEDPRAWNWYSYFNRYCGGIEQGYDGATNMPELEERLRDVMIRRFKRDVMDQLPPITRTIVPIQLDPLSQTIYQKLVIEDGATIQAVFPNGKGYFDNHLDWLNAIRQYLEKGRALAIAEWATDFLEGSENKKLVIYCGYKSTVRYLSDCLYPYGTLEITGEVGNKDRQTIIDRWQTTTHERVMLLTSAGGEGIDLFGKNGLDCSTVLFAGREWSPEYEKQIEGRLDRTGQSFPVEAVYVVCQNTIDEEINRLIERKRDVIRSAVRLADVDTTIVGDLVDLLEKRGITKKVRKE